MEAQKWGAVRDLALAIGLASVLTALLLMWAAECAPATQASTGPEASSSAGSVVAVRRSGISAAWTSTQPVTTFVPDDQDITWKISQYGVTITFPSDAFWYEDKGAIFTFTPRLDLELDPPLASTPYFFELEGVYVGAGEVSLDNDIHLELEYQEAELGEVQENRLDAFWFEPLEDNWLSQNADVNLASNYIEWDTRFTGRFGVGGPGPQVQVYLPAIRR